MVLYIVRCGDEYYVGWNVKSGLHTNPDPAVATTFMTEGEASALVGVLRKRGHDASLVPVRTVK